MPPRRKRVNLFENIPDYIKDLVEDIAKEYTPSKGNDLATNNSLYAVNLELYKERLRRQAERKAEEELNKREPTVKVKITRAELAAIKKAEEKAEKEKKELYTVPDEPIIEEEEDNTPFEVKLEELIPKEKKDGIWDFSIDDKIPFFDISLSYELSGYRPINETEGLDFDPEWFLQSRRNKEKTGHYINKSEVGLKAYDDFWLQEYDRLNDGMEVNGYRITGDHYFFLNYYQLMNDENVKYAGQGRLLGFADFYVALYEYFHYVELCKRTRKNCISLKGRGLGWSEIAAAIVSNTYHRSPQTRSVITAFSDFYLDKTLNKVWTQLNYCNEHTDGGLFNPLGLDQPRKKKTYVEERTTKVEKGWLSEVEGIIADKPSKVRGDRTDVLFFEEFGSFPNSMKAYIQGDALVHVNGVKIGIKLGFGTGGDHGPALAGLSKIFYNPEPYDVLPMRHRYTKTGEVALTGFFIPSYRIVVRDEDTGKRMMDKRGYTPIKEGMAYYNNRRSKFSTDPEGYMIYCAEYCFVPEDALVLEGDNNFNRVLLADQLAEIKQFKRGPKIERGLVEYDFKGQVHAEENIAGFKWLPSQHSKLLILEKPRRDVNGRPFRNLYVAGIDSIDMGQKDTSEETRDPSDFCIVIKRRAFGTSPPAYVAIYKDRPNDIREAYKIALRLCEWYNCLAVLENSKISLRLYFQERNKANKYLMRRPRATQTDSQAGNSRLFGAPATEHVIHHQLDLIALYIEDYCYEIWFQEMIEELLHYSYENKRKFDIVAAMGMCELGDEELQGFIAIPEEQNSSEWRDIGYYIDENGYRRFGPIPTLMETNLGTLEYKDDYARPRTSDPRAY